MLTRPFILCFLVGSRLLAQDTLTIEPEKPKPKITFGVTTGSMSFADRRLQQGATGVVRYHFATSFSLAISPSFARVAFPTTLGGGSVSGLTDLPVDLAADHGFDVPWSPTPGLSLGA